MLVFFNAFPTLIGCQICPVEQNSSKLLVNPSVFIYSARQIHMKTLTFSYWILSLKNIITVTESPEVPSNLSPSVVVWLCGILQKFCQVCSHLLPSAPFNSLPFLLTLDLQRNGAVWVSWLFAETFIGVTLLLSHVGKLTVCLWFGVVPSRPLRPPPRLHASLS